MNVVLWMIAFIVACVRGGAYIFHNELTVNPTDTEAAMTRNVNGPGWGDHKVFYKTGATGNLFVMLAGSGGQPRFNRYVTNTAADVGMFAVGLAYSNALAYQDICAGQPSEPCQYLSRTEDITGNDVSIYKSTSVTDSIQNRLLKLLVYLHTTYPTVGWNRFFIGQSVVWSRVTVAGHSQGAGTAQIISMHYPVARVVKFAGGVFLTPASYPGIFSFIDASQIYSFTHTADGLFAGIQALDDATLQLGQFGPAASVDTISQPPFPTSHKLTTSISSSNAHGAVSSDPALTFQADGTPIYANVWRFLFNATLNDTFGPPSSAAVTPTAFILGIVLAVFLL